jgi:hypothetical protein
MIEWHILRGKYRKAEEIKEELIINLLYQLYPSVQIAENLN